jgi:DNA repair exonuclease SbcCD ATPase subunit
MTVQDMSIQYHRADARHMALMEQLATLQKKETDLTTASLDAEEALIIFQEVEKAMHEKIRFKIKDIVDVALNSIFPGKYTCDLEFSTKRDQTEAKPVLYTKEGYVLNPMTSNGGGVKDILSFSLRIALLVISKNEKVLVLDEPMKAVSVDLREDVYSILKSLSTEMGLQVIMTSHDEYAKAIADKIFEFTLIGGETNAN